MTINIRIFRLLLLFSIVIFIAPISIFATSGVSIHKNDLLNELHRVSIDGSRRSFENLISIYPEQKNNYQEYFELLNQLEDRKEKLISLVEQDNKQALQETENYLKKLRTAHLQNPLIKGKNIYVIRQLVKDARKAMAKQIGRNQNNWTTNATISRTGWNNEIALLSDIGNEINISRVYKPKFAYPVKDIDLHWNNEFLLFSSIAGENRRWHVFELNTQTGETEQLTPNNKPDVDFFDACYLPDGRIVLASTASYVGVPCIGGSQPTSDLYLLDRKTRKIRQLNFGQDCDWNPVVLNNGKVCYLRWEYTDNSHYFTRILMNMNPDGTTKKELYGSDSYFPNSLFDARPVPNHNSQFVGIVSGHHGIARSGRLMIFDPTKGRKEADGIVQEIPGFGKTVVPIVKDKLVNDVWPQFLTPFPLSEDYFLVSAKPTPSSLWGIYLVDRFDNITLVYQAEGEAVVEPFVAAKRKMPPVIPDRVNLESETSTIYIQDIYEGVGLKGIPRGTVKKLRVYAYQYGYNRAGGHDVIGLEAGWDVKRILGTVPVEADGSAMFTIPANTPISLQPLDESGSALQLMRSWMTAMPGEVLSCVGCHESQNTVVPAQFKMASRKAPAQITPWYGSTRPFSYNNEVKPVIEKRCLACHNGSDKNMPDFSDNESSGYHGFSKSYMALHPFVRRPGCESDFYTLEPMDYHSNTSDLVQMLRKGHYGVELNKEEWDRLITWIDLNVPFYGKYNPRYYEGFNQVERREELSIYYGNVSLIGERELERADSLREARGKILAVYPANPIHTKDKLKLDGWPLSKKEANKLQKKYAVNGKTRRVVDLENGVELEFVRIPAGKFILGNNNGKPGETERQVQIKEPFWMLKTEISNQVYRSIFKNHNSRHIDQQWKDHIYPGYEANRNEQPAIRMSWNRANKFCELLSEKTGIKIQLPTEEQWEWAARAGSSSDMYFGDAGDDFSKHENLADYTLRDLAVIGVDPKPMGEKNKRFRFYNFVPKTEKFNDKILVPQGTAQYKANDWGLYDMLGNVAEWTLSDYSKEQNLKLAKGGSWRDRPEYASAATRNGYFPYQKVFNVGFRIVINE